MKQFNVVLILIFGIGYSSIAFAQLTPELVAEVQSFTKRVNELEKTYLKPTSISSKYELDARFNDASVAYELKDYERASFLFIDVVSSEKFKRQPQYRRALYLLGDALLKMRNYVGAKHYLEKLLELGAGDYSSEAGALLLEVAYSTGDYNSIDNIYAKMGTAVKSPAVSYLAGKAFYEKKNYIKARDNFQKASHDKLYAKPSLYFMGVAYAAEKKFDLSKKSFEDVLKIDPDNARDMEIDDLAHVALGRLAYELSDFEFSIDFYNRVGRGSKHFPRALWELTWVLVAKKDFERARMNVDIIVNFQNTSASLLAEARVLRGDLSLRLKEYEQARKDFETVVQKFAPITEQMNDFTAKHQNMNAFFAAIIHDDFRGAEETKLPPLVDVWMRTDPDMQDSMQTLRDVKKIEADISYAFLLLDEMDARLGSKNKIMSVPFLAEGLIQGLDAQNRLIVLRRKFVDRQSEIVGSRVPSTKSTQWEVLKGELNAFGKVFKNIPQSRTEMVARENEKLKTFTALRQEIDNLSFQIKNKKAQVKAIDSYVANPSGRRVSENEKAELELYRGKLLQEMQQLKLEEKDTQNKLLAAKNGIGAERDAAQAEVDLKEKYRAKLQEAQVFLSPFGSSEELTSIQAAEAQISSHEKRLTAYFKQLDIFADKALDEIKQAVAKQRRLETSYRDSIQQLMNSSQGGAGILAYINFMKARQKFNDIVLKGDVGLIDVAWQQKDDKSNVIRQMFEDRATELKLLQESFDEVR